jgi:hypothetical protein
MAASALAAGAATALRDRSAHAADRYTCPMHPEVKSPVRGRCPICGMPLEPIPGPGGAAADMAKMPDLQAVENVRKHKILDFVRLRALPVELRERGGAAWVDDDRTVQALLYREEAALDALPAGETASFSPSAAPTEHYAVHRTAAPPVPWDASTSRVTFSADAGVALEPGLAGWVSLAPKMRTVLAVPASAVLESAEGPYVLKLTSGFRFEKQPIELGETFLKQGFSVVLSGLRAQDRVVARATFFLDANRRSGRGMDEGMAGL